MTQKPSTVWIVKAPNGAIISSFPSATDALRVVNRLGLGATAHATLLYQSSQDYENRSNNQE